MDSEDGTNAKWQNGKIKHHNLFYHFRFYHFRFAFPCGNLIQLLIFSIQELIGIIVGF